MNNEKITEKKDFRAVGCLLDVEDAKSLRELCQKTGLTVTCILKKAVHAYLPYLWRKAEGLTEEANVR